MLVTNPACKFPAPKNISHCLLTGHYTHYELKAPSFFPLGHWDGTDYHLGSISRSLVSLYIPGWPPNLHFPHWQGKVAFLLQPYISQWYSWKKNSSFLGQDQCFRWALQNLLGECY